MRWDDAAAGCLERALETQWDEGLAVHYALLPLERPDPAALERRRTQAAAWVAAHPASPGALLALARVLRQQGQWSQAEPLLHRAIAQGAGSEAWEELGHGASAAVGAPPTSSPASAWPPPSATGHESGPCRDEGAVKDRRRRSRPRHRPAPAGEERGGAQTAAAAPPRQP